MTRARDLGDFIADGAAAELVVDTTTLVVDSTNNRVGVGTASPSQALDVSGTGNFTAVTAGTLTVDDITINGSTISDGGDLDFDIGGDLNIDVDGGDVRLKDGGTQFASLYKSGDNFGVYSAISDGDLLLQGVDGGSLVTALTLDMSDAGTATFNHDIKLGDDSKALFGAGSDLEIYHNGTNSIVYDNGTGNLQLVTNGGAVEIIKAGGENMGTFATDGAVTLYHDNAAKITTTANGINVTGDVVVTNDIYVSNDIIHQGDADTKIGFDTNQINIVTNNTTTAFTDSGIFISDGSLAEDYDALSGTTPTCNVDNGGMFSLTTSGNTTFTFSGASSGYVQGFTLQLTAGGTHTITYPNSVDFAGGSAPDAPASGETDILVFITRDGGTTWYGALAIDAAG